MKLIVKLQQTKKDFYSIKNYNKRFNYNNCDCVINIGDECLITITKGAKQQEIELFRLIWEIICLYEGYFFPIVSCSINSKSIDVQELYQLNYYSTGKTWTNASGTLVGDTFEINPEILNAFYKYRDQSIDKQKMTRSLVNSFFYLRSDNYESININHKLSILLNMCDGYMIDQKGDSGNVQGNIATFLKQTISSKKIKYGAKLLGLPSNNIFAILKNERDSIAHYLYKNPSLTSMSGNPLHKDCALQYFAYLIELALRISFISKFYYVKEDLKEKTIDNINDWIIDTLSLDVPCTLPSNHLKQKLKEINKQ